MGHSYPPFTQNKKLVIHTMTILGKFTSGSTIKVARGYDGSIYVCSLYMNILFFNRINSISFIHRNNEFTEQYSFLFPNIWGECQETCTQSPYNTHSFFFPPFPALCFWVVFNYPDMICLGYQKLTRLVQRGTFSFDIRKSASLSWKPVQLLIGVQAPMCRVNGTSFMETKLRGLPSKICYKLQVRRRTWDSDELLGMRLWPGSPQPWSFVGWVFATTFLFLHLSFFDLNFCSHGKSGIWLLQNEHVK